MLESIIQFDIDLFLFLNGFHNSFWDEIMVFVSGKFSWIPLYATVLFFIFKNFKVKKALIWLVSIIIVITLSDQISTRGFKKNFKRLRPCHNTEIQHQVHTVKKCGGKYGFVSSHASNSFAFAIFTLLMFRKRKYSIFIIVWAALVSYSRIYLGVHFPADIFFGGLLGILISILIYFSVKKYIITQINP